MELGEPGLPAEAVGIAAEHKALKDSGNHHSEHHYQKVVDGAYPGDGHHAEHHVAQGASAHGCGKSDHHGAKNVEPLLGCRQCAANGKDECPDIVGN